MRNKSNISVEELAKRCSMVVDDVVSALKGMGLCEVRKKGDGIRVGDRVDERYIRIDNPERYGWDADYYYYRALDRVVQVDPDTRQVLTVIGLVSSLLN